MKVNVYLSTSTYISSVTSPVEHKSTKEHVLKILDVKHEEADVSTVIYNCAYTPSIGQKSC